MLPTRVSVNRLKPAFPASVWTDEVQVYYSALKCEFWSLTNRIIYVILEIKRSYFSIVILFQRDILTLFGTVLHRMLLLMQTSHYLIKMQTELWHHIFFQHGSTLLNCGLKSLYLVFCDRLSRWILTHLSLSVSWLRLHAPILCRVSGYG